MDWPSRELSQRLAEWNLCTPQDLHRCRPFVRRFVRDLPSFDSVWIDALQQQRSLTPFQARILDSSDPDRLRLAGYIMTDCIEENAWRGVYRARPIEGGEHCLLTVHSVHPEDRVRALEAMDETVVRLRGATLPGLNSPLRAEAGARELIVISPDVRGTSLRELLVRRGRFPAADVVAIARSLAETLAAAEERGVVHGDLRPRNVWLGERGEVHLLHAGNLPAVMPTFFATQELPLEVSDGVAPELAPGGRTPDVASDQYALGCLLWQIVAGRPPFPTGDAHAKVTAHQSKRIVDIREFAPQTPPALADVIVRLTHRAPSARFPSFRGIQQALGTATTIDRRHLRRFVNSFETGAPTQTARETGNRPRQLPSALAAALVCGATVWLLASDPSTFRRNSPRSISVTPPAAITPAGDARPLIAAGDGSAQVVQASGTSSAASSQQALPAPDESGVIWLKSGVMYEPHPLSAPGPLVIRAAEGSMARVVIRGAGWHVQADLVRFENVQLECFAPLHLQSRGLELVHSVCVGTAEGATAIEWRPRDAAAAAPGTLTFTDSQLVDIGLTCISRPSFIRLTNCLKTGRAPLLQLPATGRAHQALPVHVIHSTLRDSGPLIVWSPGKRAAGQRTEVLTKSCVFAPGPESALLGLAGSLAPPEWERSIALGGLESLIQAGTPIVDLAPAPGKPRGAIDSQRIEVEGLLTASIEFFASNLDDPGASALKSTDASFSVEKPPGIDAGKVAARVR